MDANGYPVANFASSLSTVTANQHVANLLPPYTLSLSNSEIKQLADYTIQFTPTNAIPTTGSIQITWPSQVQVDTDAGCEVTTSKTFSENCRIEPKQPGEEVDYGGIVTITGVFVDQTNFEDPITVKLGVYNPAINVPGQLGFGIQTFADEDGLHTIDYLSYEDSELIPYLTCNFPCKTCSATDPDSC